MPRSSLARWHPSNLLLYLLASLRWQVFHSVPCHVSSDGWTEFSRLRATPHVRLLCVHCGEPHQCGGLKMPPTQAQGG